MAALASPPDIALHRQEEIASGLENVTLRDEKVTIERRPVTSENLVPEAAFTDKVIEMTEDVIWISLRAGRWVQLVVATP